MKPLTLEWIKKAEEDFISARRELRTRHDPVLRILWLLSLSILFGAAWFLLLYGRNSLYVSHVDWIYNLGGDTLEHQLGWEWFRQEPWRFPLGRIEAYAYPFGTSLTYMDAIPLLAIPLKLFSPWLGDQFQYQGLWELASVIGQFLVTMLILGEFTRSYFLKLLGASLLVLSPPMISRAFASDSLTTHWILLAAIWFILLEFRRKLWRGAWIALFAAAMMVHVYFVAMLLPLWGIGLFFHYAREKKKWVVIFDILAITAVNLLVGYCTGLFNLSVGSLMADGLGFFSWNLNGFFNTNPYSLHFLNQLAVGTNGQYEGFSYLGLGNLLILAIALFLFLQTDHSRRQWFFFLPFGLAAILLSLFALSQKAFLGTQPLWDIPLHGPVFFLLSIFRSSGRFIWPVFYFIVLFGLISTLRYYRYPALILIVALLLQYIDLQPLYVTKQINNLAHYQSNLQAEFWQPAAKTNRHIILIPGTFSGYSFYEPIVLYARQNKLTLSWALFARGEYSAVENYAKQVWEDLKVGQADAQTIYIFWGADWIKLAQENLSGHMFICQVDGYNVVLSEDNELTRTHYDLSHDCSGIIPAAEIKPALTHR